MPHPVIVMILHNSVFDSSLFNFAGVKWGVGWGGGGDVNYSRSLKVMPEDTSPKPLGEVLNLPRMAYMERLHPKGVPFSSFRYTKG